MKYFLIAGEASGDLHASRLMQALRRRDPKAEFCFYGGDEMSRVGGTRLCHYMEIAYMGFVPVLLHLPTILNAMRNCRRFISRWQPKVVILVDYPGFNLGIAKYVHKVLKISVFYYILPKVWAWKEHRVEQLKQNVDERFSILPFEVSFFNEKHQCPVHYVGNPSVDEISAFCNQHKPDREAFLSRYGLSVEASHLVALLPGSRIQEIRDNFPTMLREAFPVVEEKGGMLLVAGAPNIPDEFYRSFLAPFGKEKTDKYVRILRTATLSLLQYAEVALVTSGTATLETALMRVPQVVCYLSRRMWFGKIMHAFSPYFLKVKYISLVNLIVDKALVFEVIGCQTRPHQIRNEILGLMEGGICRQKMLDGYDEMISRLGPAGAPERAAEIMEKMLSK